METDRRRVQDRIAKIIRRVGSRATATRHSTQGRQRKLWAAGVDCWLHECWQIDFAQYFDGFEVFAENKLFATLDPTTRRLRLPTNQNALLTDTVGFIRKLPHGLVEAFKATLEEVVQADLLVHVVDVVIRKPSRTDQSVDSVLKEIGAEGKPTIMVFNKIDRLTANEMLAAFLERFPHGVTISATTARVFRRLLAELGSQLRPIREFVELAVPHSRAEVIARLHEVAQVIERNYDGDLAEIQGAHSSASSRGICAVFHKRIANSLKKACLLKPRR